MIFTFIFTKKRLTIGFLNRWYVIPIDPSKFHRLRMLGINTPSYQVNHEVVHYMIQKSKGDFRKPLIKEYEAYFYNGKNFPNYCSYDLWELSSNRKSITWNFIIEFRWIQKIAPNLSKLEGMINVYDLYEKIWTGRTWRKIINKTRIRRKAIQKFKDDQVF